MVEKVIFEGYDVYHKVKPSQVADLLRQTKYKDALERVERGELVFQHCWLWKNGSDYPIDWDCDVFFMQKDDTVEKFFKRVLKHLDDVCRSIPLSDMELSIGNFRSLWRTLSGA